MESNFISEIISNHSESEIRYLNESIQNVSDKINLLKLNVKEKMEEKYVNFVPIVEENERVLQGALDLIQDVKQLQTRLDTQTKRDIEDLTEELKGLKESLIEASTTVEIVHKLCKIDTDFKEAKEKATLKEYYLTAKYFNEISRNLNEECKDLEFLDLYKSLTSSITFYKDMYCRESVGQWRKSIVWTRIDGDLKNKSSHTSLSVSAEKNYLENLMKTFELYNVSDREMASFGDSLLKLILIPIINMDSTVTVKPSGMSSEELSVACSSNLDPPYKKVLENLIIVFQFIDRKLGINMQESTFLTELGKYISEEFLNLLLDKCLSAIPLKKEHLKNYDPVVEPITAFQSHLVSIGFLPESNKVLEEYFKDKESLFVTKRIEMYLFSARLLMKKDLHDIVEVGSLPFSDKKTLTESKIKAEASAAKSFSSESLLMDVDKLCPNLFTFPKCSVSKSVEELIQLVNEILQESSESDSKTCVKLFHIAREIISIYPGTVSMYHSKLLHDIPQYSALLYNNLMYLAHFVLTIDYDKKSQTPASNTSQPPFSCFADLILPLRKEAVFALSLQIQQQQKILIKLIKESGLSSLSEFEELPENTEKSIRACLKQLTLLKAVWEKVLPSNIYNQLIGGFCTVIIDEITSRVVATSDIRADIATSLAKVLSHIQTEAPRLFSDPNEVYLHVKSWSKLKELILVLGASLAEVGERWADGKGPLAMEFTAEQVRQMVKALFQVSDRRTAVLARIK